jgi:predicted 3-demethylubiquinone-9 3-methyltransferase (glyoxalase superfamily)
MGAMASDPDQKKADKAMKAMMTMVKLDIAKIKPAYES